MHLCLEGVPPKIRYVGKEVPEKYAGGGLKNEGTDWPEKLSKK